LNQDEFDKRFAKVDSIIESDFSFDVLDSRLADLRAKKESSGAGYAIGDVINYQDEFFYKKAKALIKASLEEMFID